MEISLFSKGNIRLWVVLSAVWIAVSGWALWPAFPATQDIDMSDYTSSRCAILATPSDGVTEEQIEKQADQILQSEQTECLKKSATLPPQPFGSVIAPEIKCAPSPDAKSMKIVQLRMQNLTVELEEREKAKKAYNDCQFSEEAIFDMQIAHQQRLASVAAEMKSIKSKLIGGWALKVFLPLIILPLFIWAGMFICGWVSAGYRRK